MYRLDGHNVLRRRYSRSPFQVAAAADYHVKVPHKAGQTAPRIFLIAFRNVQKQTEIRPLAAAVFVDLHCRQEIRAVVDSPDKSFQCLGSGAVPQLVKHSHEFFKLSVQRSTLFNFRTALKHKLYRSEVPLLVRALYGGKPCHVLRRKHEHGGHQRRRQRNVLHGIVHHRQHTCQHRYLPGFKITRRFLRVSLYARRRKLRDICLRLLVIAEKYAEIAWTARPFHTLVKHCFGTHQPLYFSGGGARFCIVAVTVGNYQNFRSPVTLGIIKSPDKSLRLGVVYLARCFAHHAAENIVYKINDRPAASEIPVQEYSRVGTRKVCSRVAFRHFKSVCEQLWVRLTEAVNGLLHVPHGKQICAPTFSRAAL